MKEIDGIKFFSKPNKEGNHIVLKGCHYLQYDAVSYEGKIHELGDDCLVKRAGAGRIAACLLLTAGDEAFIVVYYEEAEHFSICKLTSITSNGDNPTNIENLISKWVNFVNSSNSKPRTHTPTVKSGSKPKPAQLNVQENTHGAKARKRQRNDSDSEEERIVRKRKAVIEPEESSESVEEILLNTNRRHGLNNTPSCFTLHDGIEEDRTNSSALLLEVPTLVSSVNALSSHTKEQLVNVKNDLSTFKDEVNAKFGQIDEQLSKFGASLESIISRTKTPTRSLGQAWQCH